MADLLRGRGYTLGLVYDLSDDYRFVITLDAVVAEAKSTGACVAMEGCGASPPEDSVGESFVCVHAGCDVVSST